MEEICRVVLEKCISLYEELQSDEELQGNKYGAFPQCVQLNQFRTIHGKTKLSNIKEDIRYWKYENTELKSVETIKERTLFVRDGMFYDVASFDFEIEKDKVIIEYIFGPRFGRGLEYKIKRKNGQIMLVDEKHLWAS